MSKQNTKISRKKSTKRFDFRVSRNTASHQTGANTVTIQPKAYQTTNGRGTYSFDSVDQNGVVTMSVREARALYNFLGKTLNQ
tara:strand:+ start:630 stop:878 length:249 start_codon:yes stop_codon:yes gene_type:complete